GFRNEISPHGAGVAIDIDAGDNPYIMHEGDYYGKDDKDDKDDKAQESPLSKELHPVYHRIAEFMLNDPINGEQSIIPKLITTGESLSNTKNQKRRDRLGEYYDRLAKESSAMQIYFRLMNDDTVLKAFLAGDWKKLHPTATAPAIDDLKK